MLALLLCLFIVSSALSVRPPRLKAGRQAFSSKVTRSRVNGKHRVSLALSNSENIDLDLEPNTELLSSDYEEIDFSSSGKKQTLRRDLAVCWYKGQVVGESSSQVIASDCTGFDGLIHRQNGKSYIAKSSGEDDVSVYLPEDEDIPPGTCGVDHVHSEAEEAHHDVTPPPPNRRLLEANNSVNVVEIAIVSDNAYVKAYSDLASVAKRNIQILNLVQAIYQTTRFTTPTSVKIKAQYFFTAQDPYSVPVDSTGAVNSTILLTTFRSWALQLPAGFDHVHLLSGYDFMGSVIGLAYLSAVCGSYKTGVSMGGNDRPVRAVANTVAHELGHSLGMPHDGGSCSSTGFLMAAVSSCPSSGLCPMSSCSIASEETYAPTVDCLHSWTDPSCNDGVWNGAETGIDCGGPTCPACVITARPSTHKPSLLPTAPSRRPTQKPSKMPTRKLTPLPTKKPTPPPTEKPTQRPTKKPTPFPTQKPTKKPTPLPTKKPTKQPTPLPTKKPTKQPTPLPTKKPTKKPTQLPTKKPTQLLTKQPTRRPTQLPTRKPTVLPTRLLTSKPTRLNANSLPTGRPTSRPTSHHI